MTEIERLQLSLGHVEFELSDKQHILFKSKDKRLRQMILREISRLLNEAQLINNRIEELNKI
jgi:predicted component of type VI protein secretion system